MKRGVLGEPALPRPFIGLPRRRCGHSAPCLVNLVSVPQSIDTRTVEAHAHPEIYAT